MSERVHLFANGRLHVEVGIDLSRRRCVGLAIGTERNNRHLVLQGMD